VLELKGFEKILLEPGESRVVKFNITEEMLKFYNYDLEYVAESGEFEVFTGPNSREVERKRFIFK
jgi:beta-glucosidase